jgi:hypothetical protein
LTNDWQKVEDDIRHYLKDLFNQRFSKRAVQLKEVLDLGSGNVVDRFEYDAVSDDGKIVAEIKALGHPEHPKEMELAKEDVLRLILAKAEKRLLFLVDPLFYQVFCRKYRKELLLWKKEGVDIVSPFELFGYLEE